MRSGSRKQSSGGASSSTAASERPSIKIEPAEISRQVVDQAVNWKDTILREATERPGRTLALAAAAGYLVGGGVFSRLTARLLGLGVKIGLRIAVLPLVTQGLVSFGENLFRGGGMTDADSVDDDSPDVRSEKKQLRNTDLKETNSP